MGIGNSQANQLHIAIVEFSSAASELLYCRQTLDRILSAPESHSGEYSEDEIRRLIPTSSEALEKSLSEAEAVIAGRFYIVLEGKIPGSPQAWTTELIWRMKEARKIVSILDPNDPDPRLLKISAECEIKLEETMDYLSAQETLLSSLDLSALSSGNKSYHDSNEADSKTENLSPEARAVAVLLEHPEWIDEKIAEAAGVNRTSLYRMPNFMSAKGAIKESKRGFPSKDQM